MIGLSRSVVCLTLVMLVRVLRVCCVFVCLLVWFACSFDRLDCFVLYVVVIRLFVCVSCVSCLWIVGFVCVFVCVFCVECLCCLFV